MTTTLQVDESPRSNSLNEFLGRRAGHRLEPDSHGKAATFHRSHGNNCQADRDLVSSLVSLFVVSFRRCLRKTGGLPELIFMILLK